MITDKRGRERFEESIEKLRGLEVKKLKSESNGKREKKGIPIKIHEMFVVSEKLIVF